ncbi:DUF2911 domain-containing protein [Fulvivirgaceae bacterium BMA10]|uniref:DUF2911 domain-containing protein n=1 Tax=Splendidivirga corallicola TaxID=3051826 RepID=A0ABT8KT24_9BACT|nr:DUF2911 domain-containing protein [Fulvivirgaceae bacterium BMA10]
MRIFRISSFIFFLSLIYILSSCKQSPRKNAIGTIDGVEVTIDYGSPSVKGREIWGGLEPYGKVWRAGANEATTIEFSGNVIIDSESIPAGKYAFFIVPNENANWEIIFNKTWDQWGAYDYDQSQDQLRLNIEPDWSNDIQEELIYEINENTIHFAWEKVRIDIPVSVSQ